MPEPSQGVEQETSAAPNFQYTAMSFDFSMDPSCPSLSHPTYDALHWRNKFDILPAIVRLRIRCVQFFRGWFGIGKGGSTLFTSSKMDAGKVSGSYRKASGTARQASFRDHFLG